MSLRLWTVGALTAAIVISTGMSVTARKNSRSARVIETAIARIESMDFQGFEQLLAPNARFDNVFTLPNTSGTFEGRDAVIANIKEISQRFERIDFVDERLYVVRGGQTVFVEARGNFTVKGTGAPYQNTYVFAFEVNNGTITAIREYNNPLTIIQTFNIPFSQPVGSNTR
ncbi:MAG: nuclear transport factor 2 family protein [Rivularia sp. (in: cyanobacteria)]